MDNAKASHTPRTDAATAMAVIPFEQQECVLVDNAVPASFARQLERENADLLAALERCCNWIENIDQREAWGPMIKAARAAIQAAKGQA